MAQTIKVPWGKYQSAPARTHRAEYRNSNRLVTYCGSCEEVPLGYECLETSLDYGLKFWEKTKNHPVRMSPQDAPAINNKWQSSSDAAFEEKL
jgi:hypothetical protein